MDTKFVQLLVDGGMAALTRIVVGGIGLMLDGKKEKTKDNKKNETTEETVKE